MTVHLLKLCVGIDSVEALRKAQARRLAERRKRHQPEELLHHTRHVPRREAEVLDGGSLYWVIRGLVLARQPILRIDRLKKPIQMKQCALVLAPELIRTHPQARRPHQGWRYLPPEDAPADLPLDRQAEDEPPPEMAAELRALGLI